MRRVLACASIALALAACAQVLGVGNDPELVTTTSGAGGAATSTTAATSAGPSSSSVTSVAGSGGSTGHGGASSSANVSAAAGSSSVTGASSSVGGGSDQGTACTPLQVTECATNCDTKGVCCVCHQDGSTACTVEMFGMCKKCDQCSMDTDCAQGLCDLTHHACGYSKLCGTAL